VDSPQSEQFDKKKKQGKNEGKKKKKKKKTKAVGFLVCWGKRGRHYYAKLQKSSQDNTTKGGGEGERKD